MSKDSKATKTTGTLLSFTPTGEYYFAKGLKAYQRRDHHKAIKYLERAMELEPGEPMIACQLAIILSENAQYTEANRLLHMILEEWDEQMIECHYFLANNYAHLGLFKDAFNHASLYMQLEGDGEFAEDAEDLLDLLMLEGEELEEDLYEQDDLISKQEEARELLETGEFQKAAVLLKEVIEKFPEYWSAYNNLALAYYYLGEPQKADRILDEVLEKNHGNLHALCNKAVFACYENDWYSVKKYKEVLEKIKPLSSEHQFKLGTTFALIGDYEMAYSWLKRLYKQGFEGEGPFYYWLSYSAYYTGRLQTAEKSWLRVIQMNPEKEGQEPWNNETKLYTGEAIKKQLASEQLEERLFGLFLTSLSDDKEELLSSYTGTTTLENEYVQYLFKEEGRAPLAHNIASQFYSFHHPTDEADLYKMWFSIASVMTENPSLPKNEKAYASAVDYVWRKLRQERISQQALAEQYGLSVTTMKKYVKIVTQLLEELNRA
ncbi:TPR repeat-containing protein YvcD [Robertmurraya siralis]|uniref:TPR repeat-containing protein YvcD n=1 Tax=Robertmurraya siralis TaxID=77777 RepID=A0A919WI51_9BACI|nr:tetratricopeptide repeat protein [Robertmurraya siralis]GIN62380.1 TPR repeat-containing protein YvcD [Robertmurraya siralis]